MKPYFLFVRHRLVNELVDKHHLTRSVARARVKELDDDTIGEASTSVGIGYGAAPVTGFFDWIKAHWLQILQVIALLIPFLLMFGAEDDGA